MRNPMWTQLRSSKICLEESLDERDLFIKPQTLFLVLRP